MVKGIKNKYDMSKTRSTKTKFYEDIADKLFKEEKYKEAVYYYEELNKNKYSVLYSMKIAMCRFLIEDYETALTAFLKVNKDITTPPFYIAEEDLIESNIKNVCFCYNKLKRHNEAIEFCKKTKENNNGYIHALEQILYAYVYLDDTENIFKQFDFILKTDPFNKSIYSIIAIYYTNKKDYEKAFEYLMKGDVNDVEKEILYLVITNVDDEKFYKKKIEYCNIYIKAITKNEKISANEHYEEMLDELTFTYYKMGNYNKTIENYTELKDLHDKHYDYFDPEQIFEYLDYLTKFAVISYIKVKKYDEGIKTIKSFIQEEYDLPKFYLFSAILYFFKNEIETSLKYLNKIQKSEEISFDFISDIIKNSKIFDFEKTKQYIWEFTNENEEFSRFYDEITNLKFDERFFQNIILKSLEIFEM